MELIRSTASLTDKPIVYLSAGVTNAVFIESLEMAAASGAKFHGVLCGRATWLTGFAGGLSGLLFPPATGWMVDHISYSPAFVSVAILPLLGAFSLFTIGRSYRVLDSQTRRDQKI